MIALSILAIPGSAAAFPAEAIEPTLRSAMSIPQFAPDGPLGAASAEDLARFRSHLGALGGVDLSRDQLADALMVDRGGVWPGLDVVAQLATRGDALQFAARWLEDGRYDRVDDSGLPADRAALALCGQRPGAASCVSLRELWPGTRSADRDLLGLRPWEFVEPAWASARGAELVQRHTDLAVLAALWDDPAGPWLAAIHEAQALSLLVSIADPLHAVQGPGAVLHAPALADEARAVFTTVGGLLGPLRPARERVAEQALALYTRAQSDLARGPSDWEELGRTEDRGFLGAAERSLEGPGAASSRAFGAAIAQALARTGGPDGSMVYSLAARAWGPAAAPGASEHPESSKAMNEIRTLQHAALSRAATAARLWHRLFRQAVDRGDSALPASRFAADAQAALEAERSRAGWLPEDPPRRDLRVVAGLLAGLVFLGFWGWMVTRSLRNLGDGGWKSPAAGASTLLALVLLAAPVSAVEFRSPHQDALDRHRGDPPFSIESIVGPTPEQIAQRTTSSATVIGYLPYWVSPSNLPWAQLDYLAYFSVEVAADGSLGSDHGWGDAAALALIDEAHAAGVDVILSATRFGGSALAPLLGSATARANCIDNLIARMIAGNGDGLDIDFEGLNVSNRADMVTFIEDLRVAMTAAQPGSILTLATPAIDWSGSWDYDVIADNSDFLFIMGYAFAGSWSNPQPNAPLDAGGPWGTSRSLRWSAQDYVQWGGLYNAEKFIMGLPLYGYDWEATSDQIGASDAGDTDVLFYDDFAGMESGATLGYEPVSATPYAVWQVGSQWHQMWYENPASIAAKAQMARDEGIGGFGFWAMNYDSDDQALWTSVQGVLEAWDGDVGDDDDDDDDDSTDDPGDDDDSTEPATGPSPPILSIDAPAAVVVGAQVLIDASATTDPDGAGLTWQWTSVNGPDVTLVGADSATPGFVADQLGVYGVAVRVTDSEGEFDDGEVLVRSVPEEDSGLIDEGGCACSQSNPRGAGWVAMLALGLVVYRRRR